MDPKENNNNNDDLFVDIPLDVEDEVDDTSENDDPSKVLNELVGEDKKFKTVNDLAKGKRESDLFILRLQQENEGLRQELQKRTTIEDFMTRLKESAKSNNNGSKEETENMISEPVNKEDANSLTQDDLVKLLETKLAERDASNRKQNNVDLVKSKMKEAWGDSDRDVQIALNKKSKEIGVSLEELRSYAEQNPSVFLRLVGISGSDDSGQNREGSPRVPRSDTDLSKLPPSNNTRNRTYYENLRKTNPNLYWSAKIQNEMFEMATKLGEAFYS